MPDELDRSVVVEFLLRGERWVAVNTPGDRIPSHGTDMLGQRFAYDLLQVDTRRGLRDHPAGILRRLIIGVPTRECYAWGAEITHPSTARSCAPPTVSQNEAGSTRCESWSSS